MTNKSLRARFGLSEGKAAITSQIIAGTIEAGLIKPGETARASRKYVRYIPVGYLPIAVSRSPAICFRRASATLPTNEVRDLRPTALGLELIDNALQRTIDLRRTFTLA